MDCVLQSGIHFIGLVYAIKDAAQCQTAASWFICSTAMTSQNTRDNTQAFENRFTYVNEYGERCRKLFTSWESIAAEINAFSAESSSVWSVHSSKLDEYGGYEYREYKCKRKGYRRRLSRGIRCKTSIATNCPAAFSIHRRYLHYPPGQGPYNVGPKYVVVHNHDCNELEYRMDAKQRRLTSEEEAKVTDLIENYAKPPIIMELGMRIPRQSTHRNNK